MDRAVEIGGLIRGQSFRFQTLSVDLKHLVPSEGLWIYIGTLDGRSHYTDGRRRFSTSSARKVFAI
jgi:hypothetical protein